jgi:protocatechuate 3,4-dioxygenase beta subunit
MRRPTSVLSRRRLLRGLLLAAPSALLVAACGAQPSAPTAPATSPTQAPTTAPPAAPTAAPSSAPTAAPTASAARPTAAATPTNPPPTASAPSTPAAATRPAGNAAPSPTGVVTAAAAAGQALAPTPECRDADDVTPAQTEGPYYKRNTPERASLLEPGMGGTRLVVTGRVLSTRCQPVARALLDFWQADDGGQYDNVGQRLRGHQFTDAQGVYRLETIVPGLYPGRTRHIHVKVQAPSRPLLTTQLYFPDEPRNRSDGIFRSELLLALRDVPGGREGGFDFVLNVG